MKTRLALGIAFIAAAGTLSAQMTPEQLHEPQKLADGVWTMVTKGGSNASWFLFGDGVIAVDSGNETSSDGVLSAIDATTGGKKIAFLIVTNNFSPHAGGSPAFAKRGARIVTAEKFGPYFVAYLARGQGGSKAPEILTLSQRLVLSDTKKLVEVDFVGPADSGGDLVVYLPNEKILFTGDLVESGILPPLFSAELDVEGWITSLEKLGGLKVGKLVPGYGPAGPVEPLAATRAYLQECLRIAKKVIADRIPDDFLATRLAEVDLAIKLPNELKTAHFKNVQALVKRLKGMSSAPRLPSDKK